MSEKMECDYIELKRRVDHIEGELTRTNKIIEGRVTATSDKVLRQEVRLVAVEGKLQSPGIAGLRARVGDLLLEQARDNLVNTETLLRETQGITGASFEQEIAVVDKMDEDLAQRQEKIRAGGR